MDEVLAVTLPVFLVIGAGYLSVWRDYLSEGHVEGLMLFTQRVAIPCLLFAAVAGLDLGQEFDLALLCSYYAGSLAVFGLGFLGAKALFSRKTEDAVAIGFAAMFANTVLLGLPIMERAYGVDSLGPNFAIIALHAAFCYFVGITTMEVCRATQAPKHIKTITQDIAKAMFSNPLMIGVGLGLAVNLSQLTLPAAFNDAVEMLIRAALPAALFGLGGVLVRYRPEGDLRVIAYLCGLSLILHPAIVCALSQALSLSPEQTRSAVLTAAMAPGVNAYLFALVYERAMRVCASAVLIGTAASILTVSLWLVVLP